MTRLRDPILTKTIIHTIVKCTNNGPATIRRKQGLITTTTVIVPDIPNGIPSKVHPQMDPTPFRNMDWNLDKPKSFSFQET